MGEWSGALNPNSFNNDSPAGRTTLTQEYISAQLDAFERHCAGWFFWTYKKEGGQDIGWSLKNAVEVGAFPRNFGLTTNSNLDVPMESRGGVRDQLQQEALGALLKAPASADSRKTIYRSAYQILGTISRSLQARTVRRRVPNRLGCRIFVHGVELAQSHCPYSVPKGRRAHDCI